MVNRNQKLTKQEYRIVLDAYIRDFEHRSKRVRVPTDEEHKLYIEIRNKLIKLGEVQ